MTSGGYVGLSIATLLSQHHKVTAVDIIPEKVDMINNRKSPIQDDYIEKYLAEKELNLTATLDAKAAYSDADFVVIAAPGKSKLQSKEIATKREIEQASGNIVRLESQKRSGYEQYVLGKISKEKFLELKQDAENEIEAFRQTKAENEKELVVVQEELQQKKQIAGNTEVLLTADNLQQYVKKIEVDHKKNTYTEFAF